MDNEAQKKILIVDDEPHIIRVIKLSLTRKGYLVDSARNGMEALEKLHREIYDVLITDIQMPCMDGRQLCQSLHKQVYAHKPFTFLLTSRTEQEYREWASNLTNIEFLEKPLSLRWLMSRLDDHFAER